MIRERKLRQGDEMSSSGECQSEYIKCKIPYLLILRKWENWLQIHNQNRNQHQNLTSSEGHPGPRLPCLVDIGKRVSELSFSQNDRQTDRPTDQWSHNSAVAE